MAKGEDSMLTYARTTHFQQVRDCHAAIYETFADR